MANKYPKITKLDNAYKLDLEKEKEKHFYVEEKLDGSNSTITVNSKDEIKLFSRENEIKPGDINWLPLLQWVNNEDVREFILNEAKTFVDMFSNEIDNVNTDIINFHGEYLQQGRLGYNKTFKNTFWLFDISFGERTEEENNKLFWVPRREFYTTKFNTVPKLGFIKLDLLLDGLEHLIENQPSLLDNKFKREGIVIKSADSRTRYKFVGKTYEENVKVDKVEKTEDEEIQIIKMILHGENVIHHNRVAKYITKLKDANKIPTDANLNDSKVMKELYSNSGELAQDFIDEEFEKLIKKLEKLVKKQVARAIKGYVETQSILKKEE